MGCQKWLCLCASIFITYFRRSRWCDYIRRQIILEKNSRTIRPFSKICVLPNVCIAYLAQKLSYDWFKYYLASPLVSNYCIKTMYMKLLDIENFMKDVNVGKVTSFPIAYLFWSMVENVWNISTKGISSKLNLSFSTLTSSKKFACAKTFSFWSHTEVIIHFLFKIWYISK